jgi:hypothetical protein
MIAKRWFLFAVMMFSAGDACAQATSMQLGPGQVAGSELKGAGVLMRLAVPFGGRKREKVQPTFGLTTGPMWQEPTDRFLPGRLYYVPSAEVGVSLKGDPVLTVGKVDLSDAIKPRPEKPRSLHPNRSSNWRLLHR